MKFTKKILVIATASTLAGVAGISLSQEISLPTFTGKAAGTIYLNGKDIQANTQETPKPVVKSELAKVEASKPVVKTEPAKVEASKPVVKTEPAKVDAPKPVVKTEPAKVEAPKPVVKAEPAKVEAPKPVVKAEPAKVEAPKPVVKTEPAKVEAPKPVVKAEPAKVEAPTPVVKAEPAKVEAPKPVVKAEPAKVEAPKPVVKAEPAKVASNSRLNNFNLVSVIPFQEGSMRKVQSPNDINATISKLQNVKPTDKVWVKGMVANGENTNLDVEEYGVHRADTARDLLVEAGYPTEIRILHSKEYKHAQVNVYIEHNAYVKTQ